MPERETWRTDELAELLGVDVTAVVDLVREVNLESLNVGRMPPFTVHDDGTFSADPTFMQLMREAASRG